MSWFLVALIAYFLNAVAMTVDKTLLKKGGIKNPVVYTFYIAALGSVLMLFVIPFGFFVPAVITAIAALISGAVFAWALILMFDALGKDDATRVTAAIGGLVPVFVFILAWFVLEEAFSTRQIIAAVLLIAGAFLMSLDFQTHGALSWLKKKLGLSQGLILPHIRKALWLALPSAALFGVSHILTKFVYNNTTFLNGFIWTRLGSFVVVLLLLFSVKNRRDLKNSLKRNKKGKSSAEQKKSGLRFLFGQACGGASALLQQYAIFLGSVALVNAVSGVQYAIVFILVIILTKTAPKLLKEKLTREVVIQKVLAIIIIAAGLYLIR
ncbi:MAG: DMT family transporter [Patescibacteria group bacterium]|nr:DMT family transporter [Patescibacteria group bacterium]